MPVSNRAHRRFLGNTVQYPISCYSDFDVTKKIIREHHCILLGIWSLGF